VSNKRENQKPKGMNSLSNEEIQAIARQYKPIIDAIMKEYLAPIYQEIKNLKDAHNRVVTYIESKSIEQPQPQAQTQPQIQLQPQMGQNPMGMMMQNPFAPLPMGAVSSFLGGEGGGLGKDEAVLTRVANVAEAIDRIRGKSVWDYVLPRVFTRMMVKSGYISKDEAKEIDKALEQEGKK